MNCLYLGLCVLQALLGQQDKPTFEQLMNWRGMQPEVPDSFIDILLQKRTNVELQVCVSMSAGHTRHAHMPYSKVHTKQAGFAHETAFPKLFFRTYTSYLPVGYGGGTFWGAPSLAGNFVSRHKNGPVSLVFLMPGVFVMPGILQHKISV